MCIAFFLWEHPQLPELELVALFNRDEVLGRPTAASHFWRDRPCILGGRDLLAGGTWLCISRHGRAAFLTNFRELRDAQRPGAPSRGALPVDFATAEEGGEAFLEGLDGEAYPGFNLVGVDLREGRMLYLCNRRGGGRVARLPPGLHGVTNGHIDPRWPKVQEGCRRLQQLVDSGAFYSNGGGTNGGHCTGGEDVGGRSSIAAAAHATATAPNAAAPGGYSVGGAGSCGADDPPDSSGAAAVPWEALFELLSQERLLERDPERLPRTGYGAEFEARVSGIFVQPVDTPWGPFGTRSKIVLAVWRDGRAELREEYMAADGSWQQEQHSFHICTRAGGGGCTGCGGCCDQACAEKPGGGSSGQSEGQQAGQQAQQPTG